MLFNKKPDNREVKMKQQELGAQGKPWLTEEFCPGVEYDGAGNLYLAVSEHGVLAMLPATEWPKSYTVTWVRYPEELDILVQKVSTAIFHPKNDSLPCIKERRAAYYELHKRLWRNQRFNRQELLGLEDKILKLAGHSEFVALKNEWWRLLEQVKSSLIFDSRHEIVRAGATSSRQKTFLRQGWRKNVEILEKTPPLAIFSWSRWVAERLKGIIGSRPTSVRPDRTAKTLHEITREFTRREAKRHVDQLIIVAQIGCLSEQQFNRFVMNEINDLDSELLSVGVEFPPFRYYHLNIIGRLKAFQNSF